MEDFSEKLHSLLTNEYSGLNLTRILDPLEFYHKQILDSFYPLELSSQFRADFEQANLIIDVGFGGGFPLLPLAFKFPNKKFVGFEARIKKVTAVAEISNQLGLNNVAVFHKRIEDILIDTQSLVIMKAVGPIDRMLPLIRAKTAQRVYFYKGPNYSDENEGFMGVQKSWKKLSEHTGEAPGGNIRKIVGFELIVPRGTIATEKLVKLSKLN